MNKPLFIWGIILFLGFLVTQYLVAFSNLANPLLYSAILWLALVIVGFVSTWYTMPKLPKKDLNKENKHIWILSIVVGLVLTALFSYDGAYYYILISWFFLIGSAAFTNGIKGQSSLLHMSVIWILIGMFLLIVPIRLEFLFGAIGFGIPMMYYGLRE